MLRSLKDLEGYMVTASDGDIGSVADFLLDDERWVVRYLVVQTGGFLSLEGRQVLISPISFREADWSSRRFRLALTSEKVKSGPSVDVDNPVSRQYEQTYNGYYGYPRYWEYDGFWGMGAHPSALSTGMWNEASPARSNKPSGDAHLHSDKEIRGYHIQGSDEAIGHIRDCIVDDETWKVRYLVIDTSNWWLGKSVLLAPHWASRISWIERKVFVDLSRQKIKDSPEWKPGTGVNREYETRLYDYYGRPVELLPEGFPGSTKDERR